jgi:SAM-dependent methyltransferase
MPTIDALTQTRWPEDGLEAVEACPLCGQTARTTLYTNLTDRVYGCAPGLWNLYRCANCGCAYLNPRPNAETIGLAYANYATHQTTAAQPLRELIQAPTRGSALRRGYLNGRFGYHLPDANPLGNLILRGFPSVRGHTDRLVRSLPLPANQPRLLDLGCGNGDFLIQIREAGWDAIGLEPDPDAVAAARAQGLNVEQGLLDDDLFQEASFDAITMSHVIEHLHDPIATLRRCFRILKPGGKLWIATPNLDAPGHRAYGVHWRALEPPRHLVIFTLGSLHQACRKAGFRPQTVRGTSCVLFIYTASEALKRGIQPSQEVFLPPPDIARRARRINTRARLYPALSDEIVVLATRP